MKEAYYHVPLVLEPEPDGGYTVTSPGLPELITAGKTVEEALHNARDAFAAVLEIYEDEGRPLPEAVRQELPNGRIETEQLITPA